MSLLILNQIVCVNIITNIALMAVERQHGIPDTGCYVKINYITERIVTNNGI